MNTSAILQKRRTSCAIFHLFLSSISTKHPWIISGVLQGTVLGPILFLIFINDIYHCIKYSTIKCFADDTRISKAITCEGDVKALQDDIDAVVEWSVNNNMTLHEDKFEYICHSAKKTNLLRHLPSVSEFYQYKTSMDNGYSIPSSAVKRSGILVSQDLSWSTHIRSTCDKARRKACWVLSVFFTRSPTVMLNLYKSMVRSLLEYCSPLWSPTKITDIQELESVQRTFTSRIAGCHDLDYWKRLKKISLMSIQRRRERFTIMHTCKILHGVTSNDVKVNFQPKSRTGIKAVLHHLLLTARRVIRPFTTILLQ